MVTNKFTEFWLVRAPWRFLSSKTIAPFFGFASENSSLIHMNLSRRDFVKSASVLCGAAATQIPWNLEAAEAAHSLANRHDLAKLALARASKLGCDYADIRINKYRHESVFTREQQVLNISRTHDFGFGIRVL